MQNIKFGFEISFLKTSFSSVILQHLSVELTVNKMKNWKDIIFGGITKNKKFRKTLNNRDKCLSGT